MIEGRTQIPRGAESVVTEREALTQLATPEPEWETRTLGWREWQEWRDRTTEALNLARALPDDDIKRGVE